MQKLQINKIEAGFEWLNAEFSTIEGQQSIDALIEKISQLNASIAFAYNQMAIAKKELNEAKTKAYQTLAASSYANERYYAPSLAKDYVSSQCVIASYNYDLTERFCRAMVHISDNLRTAISALKEEIKMINYSAGY